MSEGYRIEQFRGKWLIIDSAGKIAAMVYSSEAHALQMAAASRMAAVLQEVHAWMASLHVSQLPNGTFNGIEAALDAAGVEYEHIL